MRQWWMVPGEDGGVLELREVPIPEPDAGEVLVRISGGGVNRGELIAAKAQRSDNPRARPARSGIEFAGVIEAVGSGVAGWKIGDRVMGRGSACHGECAVVDQQALMATPPGLSDVEAAAIPNVFVTAHDALVSAGHVGPGDVVVVTAGSSGVGTAAIQIAKHLDATTFATTRTPEKSAALLALGADAVLDTSSDGWVNRFVEQHGRATCVIDQVGGRMFPGLIKLLGVEGRYVSVGRNDGDSSTIDLDLLARNRLQLIGVTFRTRTPAEAIACSRRFAEDLLDLFTSGELRPVVDRVFPLDQLPDAHRYMQTDAQIGKVILAM